MKKLLLICCGVIAASCFYSQLVYANQAVNSHNLTLADVQPAVLSGSLGWMRVQSDIIYINEIDLNSIEVIDLHQEGNTAFVYCNFTNKQGKKLFGYVPLIRLKNSTTWINRDNGMILKK